MTRDEIRAFLSEGTRTGKVATVRADGRPHVAPIWFIVVSEDRSDEGARTGANGGTVQPDDSIVFMTGTDSVKGKSLARDPRIAISVDLEEAPYGFVMIEGVAELSEDIEAMLPYSIEIGRRYMGEDLAEQFGRRNAAPGELLVRVRPTKTVAIADMTS